MLTTIKPFDIVKANYVDLTGNIKKYPSGSTQKALFLVIAVDSGNIIACKITSQDTSYNHPDFTYTLRRESYPFLQTTSYIQLTKLHTLFVSSCDKVGEVADFCRPAILTKFNLFCKTLCNILSSESPLSYKSPNIHKFGNVKIR